MITRVSLHDVSVPIDGEIRADFFSVVVNIEHSGQRYPHLLELYSVKLVEWEVEDDCDFDDSGEDWKELVEQHILKYWEVSGLQATFFPWAADVVEQISEDIQDEINFQLEQKYARDDEDRYLEERGLL